MDESHRLSQETTLTHRPTARHRLGADAEQKLARAPRDARGGLRQERMRGARHEVCAEARVLRPREPGVEVG